MIKFIIKTILQFVLIRLCVSFISFAGLSSTGDPAGVNSQRSGGSSYSRNCWKLRAEMGLNGSFFEQYLAWLSRIVHGDYL